MEFDKYGRPITTQERPEDPIDEVIQTTEQAWEENDLYISGQRDKDLD
jgi:hypothetical protein